MRAQAAIERGIEYLMSCQLGTGAIVEPVADPLAVFHADADVPRSEVFFAMAGADIWHTVSALSVFRKAGVNNPAAETFLHKQLDRGVGASYWSARTGLCTETTAAIAILASTARKRDLCEVLRRFALPRGRWSTFIIDGPGAYETYIVGPSVTAWVLLALGSTDPLRGAGLTYLQESLGDRPIWSHHAAFYETPFYPAHVAARLLPEPRVMEYALETQDASGGWGFGDPPRGSSPLPTALALLTLRSFPETRQVTESIRRGVKWLVGQQQPNGAFSLEAAPDSLWYAGTVYTTCVAVDALLGIAGAQKEPTA